MSDKRVLQIAVKTDIGDHQRQMRNLKNNTEDATKKAGQAFTRNYGKAARKAMTATRLLDRRVALLVTTMQGAAAAGGPAGVALTGVGFAAFGAVAGVVSLGKALVEVADDARELVKVAQDRPQFIDQKQVKRLIETDDALESLKLSTQGAAIALTSVLAPDIERVTTFLVAGTLAVKDYAREIVDTSKKVLDFSASIAEMGLRLVSGRAGIVAQALADVGEAIVETTVDFDEGNKGIKRYIDEADNLIDSFAVVEDSTVEVTETIKDFGDATDTAAELAKILADAESDLLDAQTAIILKYDERIAAVENMGGSEVQVRETIAALEARRDRELAAQAAREEEEHQKKLERIQAEIAAQKGALESYLATKEAEKAAAKEAQMANVEAALNFSQSAIDSLQITLDGLDSLMIGKTTKQVERMQKMQKALAIASVIASGAQAAMGALTPPPIGLGVPGGFAMLPIIAAQVAVQIATISKGTSKKHSGGPVDRDGLAPDEVSITGKDGEFMVNGMGRAGAGDAALEALNRGERPRGGGTTVALQLDHRYFSEFVARDRRLVGSELGKALNTNKNIGYRS